MIFVSMIGAILLASLHNESGKQFAAPFIANNVPFDFHRNVLLPYIGMGFLIYVSYLVLTFFTIPRLLFPKKFEAGTSQISVSLTKMKISLRGMARKVLRNYLWLFIQIILIAFFLGTALNFAIFFKHEWQFHYPGFSVFNKNNPNSQINIFANYVIVLLIIALYGLYIFFRETIINLIEKPGRRRDFRILICNEITLFLVIFLLIPFFTVVFHLNHEHVLAQVYFSFVIPAFLVFMSNTYWLFPLKGENSFFSLRIITRLLVSTFIYTFPLVFLHFPEKFTSTFLTIWIIQLFCVTPITWLFYQRRKDEILELRGTQKALVKTKTDLQFLRSQINPHFLFNILNTLYGTALQENAERTAGGIQKLGDMMRFMLHENNQDFIDMSKEIEYLKNYISLQKLRTQSSPDIIIEENISEQNCNHKIAPMLLIPFVENAFKHGISLKEKSWIKINLECTEKNILFEVRNSVHAKQENDPETERSGIGFNNVIERLKLIYPGKFQASVNKDDKEFFVQLSIQP